MSRATAGSRAVILLAVLLAACGQQGTPYAAPAVSATPTTPAIPTAPPPTPALPSPNPTPSITPVPAPAVCDPIAGIALAGIPAAVSNPYRPSRPGYDDPHQGIDLADRQPGSQVALAGREVSAVLSGQVAAVIHDRFPFGNALIVETPLEALPASLLARLNVPAPAAPVGNRSALTCPETAAPANSNTRSLYVLYAHMQETPDAQPGEALSCGQTIGEIGSTGNALNPHLHLEVRVGPAGERFSSLAHYDASATIEEMGNYCAWSVSGWFIPLDPLLLFSTDLQP